MKAPDHREGSESIEALVGRSSFGDPDARRARATTPVYAARAIYQRSASAGRYRSTSTRTRSTPQKKS